MRRYRSSSPWPVGALALIAAAGAVLTAGTLSSALDGRPAPAYAAQVRQGVAAARSGMAAHAAVPAGPRPVVASAPPAAAGDWQIQVGAFRSAAAAEANLRAVRSEVPELARLPGGHRLRDGLDRVRIGAIADEPAARGLCARIVAVGRGCFVVGPES